MKSLFVCKVSANRAKYKIKTKKMRFYLVLYNICRIFASKMNEGTEKFPLLIVKTQVE